jgi:hypothetical protein
MGEFTAWVWVFPYALAWRQKFGLFIPPLEAVVCIIAETKSLLFPMNPSYNSQNLSIRRKDENPNFQATFSILVR